MQNLRSLDSQPLEIKNQNASGRKTNNYILFNEEVNFKSKPIDMWQLEDIFFPSRHTYPYIVKLTKKRNAYTTQKLS